MKKLVLGIFLIGSSAVFINCSSGGLFKKDQLCSNTCEYAYDNVCDDGGSGAAYSTCPYGTDCADCGPR